MPWKETCAVNEKRRFINDWLGQDWNMTDMCEHYGISRKTGYKWLERFKSEGSLGLDEQSRAPRGHPNETAESIQAGILEMRRKHPSWGPKKLRQRLRIVRPEIAWPVESTIGEILKRKGLVKPRRKSRRTPIFTGPFEAGLEPNEVWAADFKGWFRTRNGFRIDPLTVSDLASRYLLCCRAVKKTDGETVRDHYTAIFREYGLPRAMRTDNGPPFATTGAGGLSRLSVWLIRLGIRPERIRPGHPEENGIHERMHKTLKQETAKPPRSTPRAQQKAFDVFRREYNEVRPHEALDMRVPEEAYRSSLREFPRRLPEIEYPKGAQTRIVSVKNGTITWRNRMIYVSNALTGERVGVYGEKEGVCIIKFGPVILGSIDPRYQDGRTLVQKKVLPMCPV